MPKTPAICLVFLLLLLALLVAGCGSEATTPIPTPRPTIATAAAPTAAPTKAPTATAALPTPTFEPSATATETATPEPSSTPTAQATTTTSAATQRATATTASGASPTASATRATLSPVVEGRWLQRIGDCDSARRTLADFLSQEPALRDAAEARYILAQCYLRDGAASEAVTVLNQLRAEAPEDSPYRSLALFLLGEAQSQLGFWQEAEASYTAYEPLAPELSAMVLRRIAQARREQADFPGAAEAYTDALKTSPDWTSTVAIRRGLADLALASGDTAGAVAQYDSLRGGVANSGWAAEMQYLAGNALAQAGDLAGAQKRWQAAVDADPTNVNAHRAMVNLVETDAPVDEFQRGVVNYHNESYERAIDAFDRLRAEDPTGRQGAAWYFTGRSQLALGLTDSGLAELGNFVAAYPESPYWADAMMARARVQAQADNDEAAIRIYRELAEKKPRAPQAFTALMQAGYLESDLGRVGPAAEAYLDIARRYPDEDEAWRAYQSAALIHFKLGDYRKAGEIWSEMASADLPSFAKPVAHFWLGRSQYAVGEIDAAMRSWDMAAAEAPESFYGLRAAAWREQTSGVKPTPQPIPPLPASVEAERKELSDWLTTWAGEGALALPDSVLSDPDWVRGGTLLELGMRPEALSAWGRIQKRAENSPWALTALSLAFRDAGAYRLSLLSAERVVALWGEGGMRDAPVALQRLAYPYAFADLVRKEAERWDLDPRLLLAVIRQESRFETGATSVAGARGLMQVMPGTAQGIADRLGWQDFDVSQAYWPYINVALGANYVATWLEHFDGSLPITLAAYNGGPGNASVWRKWAPDDDDLMTALININESRVYVQAVQTQYEMYKRLYER